MAHDTESFDPDPDRVAILRDVADDIRGDSVESGLVAAILYRISDLYDPEEETSPKDIYINMREIIRTKEANRNGE